jgi:hypothetical protein
LRKQHLNWTYILIFFKIIFLRYQTLLCWLTKFLETLFELICLLCQIFIFIHSFNSFNSHWRQFPTSFDHVRCSNGCWLSTPVKSLRFSRSSWTVENHSRIRVQEKVLLLWAYCTNWKVSIIVLTIMKQNILFTLLLHHYQLSQ